MTPMVVSMSTAELDRLPHRGGNGLENIRLKRERPPAASLKILRTSWLRGQTMCKARQRLVWAFHELNHCDRGCVAAFCHDVWGYHYAVLADLFECSEEALRAAKCRAHDTLCCSKRLDECDDMLGPIHHRGRELVERLKTRVLSDLLEESH